MGQFQRIKIAFISSNDVLDKRSLSGSPYHNAKLLDRCCGEVSYVHNLRPNKVTAGYLLKNIFSLFAWIYVLQKSKEIFWKILGRSFVWEKTLIVSRYYARVIKNQLSKKGYGLIFTEKGSFCIACLDTEIPIIYQTDATFKAMENYYPEFMDPAPSFSREGNEAEKRALEKSELVITTSKWARDSMMKDYGISGCKIKIIPRTIEAGNVPDIDMVMRPRPRDACRLLFVGVDWERKGGDIAVEAVDWLNREGTRSRLVVCGCTPPKKHLANKNIEVAGYLNRNIPKAGIRYEELFFSAHFFILPTRAECMGQVFCEASAYGLPILATNTGGVSSVVLEGKNGYLLGLSSRGDAYGGLIQQIWEDAGQYEAMRRSARQLFDDKLSPEVWERSFLEAIRSVIPDAIKEERRS
jgi:glycosyltransferase involved in cell wall biosynthesis